MIGRRPVHPLVKLSNVGRCPRLQIRVSLSPSSTEILKVRIRWMLAMSGRDFLQRKEGLLAGKFAEFLQNAISPVLGVITQFRRVYSSTSALDVVLHPDMFMHQHIERR